MVLFDPINRFLFTIVIIITFQCGLFYLYRSYKKERFEEKILLFGFGNIWFWYAITKVIHFFNKYLHDGFYLGNAFYVDISQEFVLNDINLVMSLIGSILNAIGYIIFVFSFEVATKGTHYILPIYQIIITIFSFVFFPTINTIFAINNMAIIAFVFIWLIRRNPHEELQGFIVAMTIGLLIFYLGNSLDSNVYYQLQLFPTWFPALFLICGALITLLPTVINPEKFTRPLFLWAFFSVFIFSAILFIIYLLTFWNQFTLIVNISILFALILNIPILGFGIKKILYLLKPPQVLKELSTQKGKEKDLITTFIKPQRVTEEEVSISKEKKICLVCKTKLSKEIFFYSNCGTFYCIKCEQALSESENMCWVCNTPFDELKPSKSFEKEKEEEILISKEKKDI